METQCIISLLQLFLLHKNHNQTPHEKQQTATLETLSLGSSKYHRDLARHFKTEPTETVAFCFGISENTVSSSLANWYCVNWLDEEGIKETNWQNQLIFIERLHINFGYCCCCMPITNFLVLYGFFVSAQLVFQLYSSRQKSANLLPVTQVYTDHVPVVLTFYRVPITK
jgi:hypothetical protein